MFYENRLRGSVKKGPCSGSYTYSQQVRGLGFQTQVFMRSIYTKVKNASLIDRGCESLERTNRRVVEEALIPPCQGNTEVSRQENQHYTLLMCYS